MEEFGNISNQGTIGEANINSQNALDQNYLSVGGDKDLSGMLTPDELKSLLTSLSTSNVPQTHTTLPPDYYYPSRNQGVAIGQMSTPLGSLNTYSPGSPLLPLGVLDAAEKENRAMRQKWYEEQFKPFDDYQYFSLDHKGLNQKFFDFQDARIKALEQEYLRRAGGNWITARMLSQKEQGFKRLFKENQIIMENINNSYEVAKQIVADAQDKDKYVSPYVYEKARAFLDSLDEGDFYDNYDNISKYRRDFVSTMSAYDVFEHAKDAINESVVQGLILKPLYIEYTDENGNITNVAEFKNSITQTAQRLEEGGLLAYGEEEIQGIVDDLYNSYSSKYIGVKDFAIMPKDEFQKLFLSSLSRQLKAETEKITNTDAWINHYLNNKPVVEIEGDDTEIDIGELKFPAKVWGVDFKYSGGVGQVLDKTTGRFNRQGTVMGQAVAYVEFINPQTKKIVPALAVVSNDKMNNLKRNRDGSVSISYNSPDVKFVEITEGGRGHLNIFLNKKKATLKGSTYSSEEESSTHTETYLNTTPIPVTNTYRRGQPLKKN